MVDHVCPVCAQPFTHKKRARTYCSMACRDEALRRRGSAQPGTFAGGGAARNHLPVGAVTIRTRHKRNGDRRAFVKIAEPNVWRERAVVMWEQANGPRTRGCVIHHVNEDSLDDRPENLVQLTRAEHRAVHAISPNMAI